MTSYRNRSRQIDAIDMNGRVALYREDLGRNSTDTLSIKSASAAVNEI